MPSVPLHSAIDPEERIELLLRDLHTSRTGLTGREAQRRLVQFGPNVLERRRGRRWPRELAHQFTHPLALLLWAAAGLAWVAGILPVAVAIVIVIVANAAFAFIQEVQAERAVEALARYLPERARVLRDREPRGLAATELAPGDVVLLGEGERISADARLLEGALEVDISTLTGESMPVFRSASYPDTAFRRFAPATWCSAARPAPRGRRARSCSPLGCAPSWDGSLPSRSGSSARRARSSARSGASPG